MASTIAIISASTHYSFLQTGHRVSGLIEGVSLHGPLGGLVVWQDGTTGVPSQTPGDQTYAAYSTTSALRKAQADASAWLNG